MFLTTVEHDASRTVATDRLAETDRDEGSQAGALSLLLRGTFCTFRGKATREVAEDARHGKFREYTGGDRSAGISLKQYTVGKVLYNTCNLTLPSTHT